MRQHVSTLTRKGQVTIPVEVRRLLGMSPRDKVAFLVEDDKVQIMPARSVVARTAGMLKDAQPRLSEQDERAAIEEGVAEEAMG